MVPLLGRATNLQVEVARRKICIMIILLKYQSVNRELHDNTVVHHVLEDTVTRQDGTYQK